MVQTMSEISVTIADARREAEVNDCLVIEGGDGILLLDLDTKEAVAQFLAMKHKLNELCGITEQQWWSSKSGNTHARIYINLSLTAAQRVAMQAALGSDGWREMFAVRRLVLEVEEPSLLFKPKKNPMFSSYEDLEASRNPAKKLPF